MSLVSALLPSISPADSRTGAGSGTPDNGAAAFANVLKTVLEKTQASAPPANPPAVAASTGARKPLTFPQSKSGAGAYSGKANAPDDSEESPPKASVAAAMSPSGGALDLNSLSLAALVQAAAAQVAPAPSPSSEVTPGAPTSPKRGSSATAGAPSVQASATAGAPSAQTAATAGAPSVLAAATSAAPSVLAAATSAAPSVKVPALPQHSPDAGATPVPDISSGSADPAPTTAGVAQASILGSTTSAGDSPAGSVMAALQTAVSAAPMGAPTPTGSAAPSPRPVSTSRSAKAAPAAAAVSDAGAASSNASTTRASPAGTTTAPAKATTSEHPAPLAAAAATPWTGVAEAGAAAAQVAGALATLAQGPASAPTDPGAAAASGVGQGTATTASTGADASTSATASSPGMREMTIQLDPEHLGSVAITMRMAGGKLQIDIRVAKAQTLDVLNQDRHILSAAVEAAGASRDNFSLGAASDHAPAPDQGRGLAGSGTQDGASQQQTFSSRGSSDGGGGGQGPAAGNGASDMTRDDDNEPVSNAVTRGLDGSLYV